MAEGCIEHGVRYRRSTYPDVVADGQEAVHHRRQHPDAQLMVVV